MRNMWTWLAQLVWSDLSAPPAAAPVAIQVATDRHRSAASEQGVIVLHDVNQIVSLGLGLARLGTVESMTVLGVEGLHPAERSTLLWLARRLRRRGIRVVLQGI